ncbi:beta-phosphoglucomutase-like phosphatase (HAD superfamily) [Nonomuraea thailandensis]|uniref:Beta-phosphoglucomutase-like phosphatase (HAD superfamily) n=1 Tax=Nonomuraea thailandensis TaxID=1188745 RepID=A0A9X2JYP5_9ACTN|nr:HAD family phosphatase [Nonomuraea thailandensis]MCP2353349.1 beta-phosphoglucomutase-like phosphatase (HAD superfamily) [Nonomuraea thailandensis]
MSAIPDGIEALILDFDGTLADTTPGHEQALRAALQPHGHDLDHDWYRRHVGLPIHDLLAALPGGQQLPHDEIIRASRAHLLATVHHITAIACVAELLHAARRAGLHCAVASAASRVLVHSGLEALGLRHAFATVVAREDVTHGKPAPDLYLAAAQRLDVPPNLCLAVDDAPDGVASARAAGIRHVITVADGHLAPTGDGTTARARRFASAAGEVATAPHDTGPGTGPGSTPPRCTDSAR